ncbi:hypothetical protein M2359_001086 [Gordonia amarae]|uniref:Uncharacterized protein n=1 Tax=Gordonia amarae NBRC 15530 TaxID=1075090 RepID=G7GUC2_9ACTN|nr:hypothetical protein [Gordonia amarae]MCS3877457.1 hypothetical protein [Gordonia amarae]GAB07197.1 hypothetical protein GOAMR_63_00440 [Gordonia amarae NBRC 15530]
MLGRRTQARVLWMFVHADKVLTNFYIVYALTAAPAVLVLTDNPVLHRAMWWSLILGAIALAVLGVIMAVGMGVIVSRGESLDFDWFRSHFVPDTENGSGQAYSGPGRVDGIGEAAS